MALTSSSLSCARAVGKSPVLTNSDLEEWAKCARSYLAITECDGVFEMGVAAKLNEVQTHRNIPNTKHLDIVLRSRKWLVRGWEKFLPALA